MYIREWPESTDCELVAAFFFFLNYRLGADSRLWFSCPAVLDDMVVLDQGLAEDLRSLTARENETTNGPLDTSHPIS